MSADEPNDDALGPPEPAAGEDPPVTSTESAPTPEAATTPYTVGYGRPPREHQFKKNQSGNPNGRPKGARGFRSVLRDALETRVQVQERDGRTRRKRVVEMIVQRDIGKALKGEDKALQRVQSQARSLDLEDESRASARRSTELAAEDAAILARYAPAFATSSPQAVAAPAAAPAPTEQMEDHGDE